MHCRLVSPLLLLYFLELLSSFCFFHIIFFFYFDCFCPFSSSFLLKALLRRVVQRISSVFIFHHIFWHFVSTCCSLRPFISVTCVNVVFFSTNTRSSAHFTVMIKKKHTHFILTILYLNWKDAVYLNS